MFAVRQPFQKQVHGQGVSTRNAPYLSLKATRKWAERGMLTTYSDWGLPGFERSWWSALGYLGADLGWIGPQLLPSHSSFPHFSGLIIARWSKQRRRWASLGRIQWSGEPLSFNFPIPSSPGVAVLRTGLPPWLRSMHLRLQGKNGADRL